MNENTFDIKQSNEISLKRANFFQIDLLKTLMIGLVIIDHSLVYSNLNNLGLQLWERIAIPMFLVIMGFNMGKSFSRVQDKSLKGLYSRGYFKKKFWRYVYPYIILYIVGTLIGFILYGLAFPGTFNQNWFLEYILFQKSLLEGPGNWFIPVLFQSIVIMPLIYKGFSKWPKITLIFCFIIEFLMHLMVFFIVGQMSIAEIPLESNFRYIILMYVSALGIGMWFSKYQGIFSKKNLFVWILFPVSTLYMIAWEFFNFRLAFDGASIVRGDYNYLTFLYSGFIFLIALNFIPENPNQKVVKIFKFIGRSTFHIFLVQDIYYATSYIIHELAWSSISGISIVNILGITTENFLGNFILLIMNWIVCISCGVIWWYIDKRIIKLRLEKKVS
ncbi:MAG: acyltransferase family protein [Candidatus Thorarchaeota archaeon]